MRDSDAATLTAIAKGEIIPRHFFWITPRHLTTGVQLTPVGFWNDAYDLPAVNVIDGQNGATVSRAYAGAGKVTSVDQLVLEVGIAVRTATVVLNILDPAVESLARGTQLRKAPIEWHFGLLNVSDRKVVSTLRPLFTGFINTAPITTPGYGGSGGVSLEMVSNTRRLTIRRGDKRSDESQKKRSATDAMHQYNEVMASREIFWGLKRASENTGGPGQGRRFGIFTGLVNDVRSRQQ